MQIIKNERIVFFDVDGTLVETCGFSNDLVIRDPYLKRNVRRAKHMPHIRLLTNYVARGFDVFVWSKNGYQWAAAVLTALGLDQLDIKVLTKPCVYVDDEPPENWLGERVFIPATSSFGKD